MDRVYFRKNKSQIQDLTIIVSVTYLHPVSERLLKICHLETLQGHSAEYYVFFLVTNYQRCLSGLFS